MEWILTLSWDESGASAVEYALLLVGIAITVAGSLAIFGSAINGLFAGAVALFPN